MRAVKTASGKKNENVRMVKTASDEKNKKIGIGDDDMGKDRFQKKITAAIYCKKGLNQCCVRLYRGFDEVCRLLNQDCCKKEKKQRCYKRR